MRDTAGLAVPGNSRTSVSRSTASLASGRHVFRISRFRLALDYGSRFNRMMKKPN